MITTHSLPLFTAIAIQTNSRCNLRCPFCFYGQYADYNADSILPTDLIVRLFEQLRDLNFTGRVALYNMNEPLTDDRILDLLRLAKTYLPGASHFFSTNGLLLNQHVLDQLTGLVDHLRINQYRDLPPLDYSHPILDLRDKRQFRQHADQQSRWKFDTSARRQPTGDWTLRQPVWTDGDHAAGGSSVVLRGWIQTGAGWKRGGRVAG